MKISRKMAAGAGTALVVAALSGAGTALASIPDSGGVIHGCYSLKGGTLRVIDTNAGQSCVKGENALTWDQAGPQGPTGPQGPAATAQDVTSQVVYTVPPGGITQVAATLDCPSGTLALNGGVKAEQPAPLDPGALFYTQGGSAVEAFDQEADGNGQLGLPRPVNNGASWRIRANLVGAEEVFQNGGTRQTLPITVTYYVICE